MFEFASSLVGYEFDTLDWDAVAIGLRDTDVERQQWFEYPLSGRQSLALKVALDPGSSVVFVEAEADGALAARLDAAAELMATFWLRYAP